MPAESKWIVIGVLLHQALDVFGYNLQQPSAQDSNGPDVPVRTITINQYPYEKVNMAYPSSGVDYESADQTSLDTWSVVWYIASFAGLILFFLIVSCSEWCCRRNARRNCQRNSNYSQSPSQAVPDTPPPSYDQFAPPSYEDLLGGSSRSRRGEKSEYDIYVVPVHALGTLMEEARIGEAPPPYHHSTNAGAVLPRVHPADVTSGRVT